MPLKRSRSELKCYFTFVLVFSINFDQFSDYSLLVAYFTIITKEEILFSSNFSLKTEATELRNTVQDIDTILRSVKFDADKLSQNTHKAFERLNSQLIEWVFISIDSEVNILH